MNPINLFCFKTLFGLLHHANASKDFCETTAKKSAILKKKVNVFHIQISLLQITNTNTTYTSDA